MPWKQGQSGNPKGRPIGKISKPHKTKKVDSSPNCVYVFGTHGDHYKIGISRHPKRRLQSVQCYVPFKVHMIDYVIAQENALEIEQSLHMAYNHCRTFGEWFRLDEGELQDVLAYIRHCANSSAFVSPGQFDLFSK